MNVVREWKWYEKIYRRFVYYFRRKRRFVRETELGKISANVWSGKWSFLETMIWKCTTMLRAMRIAAAEAECYVFATNNPEYDNKVTEWLGKEPKQMVWDVPPEKLKSMPEGIDLRGTRKKFHTLWAFRKMLKDYYELDDFKMSYSDYLGIEKKMVHELAEHWLNESGDWLD